MYEETKDNICENYRTIYKVKYLKNGGKVGNNKMKNNLNYLKKEEKLRNI